MINRESEQQDSQSYQGYNLGHGFKNTLPTADHISEMGKSNPMSSANPQSHAIMLTARYKNLDTVREYFAAAAQEAGFSEKQIYEIQMAVDEAFTNVIEHSYGGETNQPVECSYEIQEQGMLITMKDYGEPFNPEDIPAPDLLSDIKERNVGGLGMHFIHNLMDEVDFEFVAATEDQRAYNLLRMIKLRRGKRG